MERSSYPPWCVEFTELVNKIYRIFAIYDVVVILLLRHPKLCRCFFSPHIGLGNKHRLYSTPVIQASLEKDAVHQFVVLTITVWFIVSVCPLQGPLSPMEQAVLLLNRPIMLSQYFFFRLTQTSRRLKRQKKHFICTHFKFLLKDKLNATVLHCVEYSWRLQWNGRLMKDFYLLRLLTSLMTSGISLKWFGEPGMKAKMFNLAVKCTGCWRRCNVFWQIIWQDWRW